MQPIYGVTICGSGPAGIGPLIYAVRHGRMSELLNNKIALIEKTNNLGGGHLFHYNINSNTLAKVLLEAFDTPESTQLFSRFIPTELINQTKNIQETYPSCRYLGEFLNFLGKALKTIVTDSPGSQVFTNTSVKKLFLNENKTISILINNSSESKLLVTKNILLTLGAEQELDDIINRVITPEITLLPYKDKVILSSLLLSEDKKTLLALKQKLPTSPKIVIIAGSHSGWSSAWYCLNKLATAIKRPLLFDASNITLMHRSPIRLFYKNKKEAEKDFYSFNEEKDVCPLSGRINRFSGLRGDSLELAKAAMRQSPHADPSPIKLVSLTQAPTPEIIKALNKADIIIPAFGYKARTVPIIDYKGSQIKLAFNESGLVTTENACVVTSEGNVLSNIMAYGLGAGMRPSSNVGGENSLNGRIDGVWLFQNDVGKVVLNTVFQNLISEKN